MSPVVSDTESRLLDLVRARAHDPARREPVCLYAHDLDALVAHVAAVVAALPARFRMFYAMKANSAPELLAAVAPHVHGLEVASGGELTAARAAAPGARVLVGGPAKTDALLADALAAGVTRFHVEGLLECHRLSEAAVRAGTTATVLLRVNLAGPFPDATLAMAGRPTQFGIDEAELPAAVEATRTLPGLDLAGFHLHSVSNNLDAGRHLAMLALYRDAVAAWEERFGLRVRVVNAGGGIGVDYADLDHRFDWAAFTRGLAELDATLPAHWEEVDFECGRFLVAGTGVYAAEVLDVKRVHGTAYALLRGGTHHFRLPQSWAHSHPFTVVAGPWPPGRPRPAVEAAPVTVAGELCTPKDVLARDVVVERLRVGDVVVFRWAGAYGWDISHHDFLRHPHPEHVWLGRG